MNERTKQSPRYSVSGFIFGRLAQSECISVSISNNKFPGRFRWLPN